MGNNNDYSDAIALVAILLLIVLTYIFNEYLADILFHIWYFLKKPLFLGLDHIPEEVRKIIFSYGSIMEYIEIGLDKVGVAVELSRYDLKLSDSIGKIANEFREYTKEDLFNRENRGSLMSVVNKKTVFILLPITLPVLVYLSKKIAKKQTFKRTFSIETLGIQEAKIWRQIKPVVHEYNAFINAKSLDEEWFAMSPKPAQYFKKNDLLAYEKNTDESDIDNYGKTNFRIKADKMHEFFVKELGKPWTGIESMSFEKKAILAIILPKILRQKIKPDPKGKAVDKSKYMNDRLAEAYSSVRNIKVKGKMVKDKEHEKEILAFREKVKEEVEEQMKEYFPTNEKPKETILSKISFGLLGKKEEIKEMHPKIKEVLDKHYHEKVIFSVFLDEARKTGVLASCEFIWLKKENRDLWYIMSQTGRTACFCESAGAWAHLLTEKKVGRKIPTPMVHKAIDAADKYLFESHDNYLPLGDFDDD